jgi:hypothetical protein
MEGEELRPLDAQLEQVTATLKESLDEACGTDVRRLDTGESVRIEEVLAIASEAAKKVVSIRRKRRQLRKRPRTSGQTSARAVGTHRSFVDERGVRWDAFAVMPSAEPRGLVRLPEPYQHGWLCFESATEKRRLGPIPEGWETATDDQLRRYRDVAQLVQQRTTPSQGRDRV